MPSQDKIRLQKTPLPYVVRCSIPGCAGTMEAVIFMKRLFSPLSEEAFGMVRGTLCVSCAMLFCSVMVLLHIGELDPRTYALYRLAAELETASGGFLLLGNAAALVLENLRRR